MLHERLAPTAINIESVPADHPEARLLMEELNQRLAQLCGASGAASFNSDAMPAGRSVFLIARSRGGAPLGCGAVRPLVQAGTAPVAELKRLYARDGTRGVGAALLRRLETAALQMGYRAMWLETRRLNTRALAFYRRFGYRDIPNYGSYVGRDEAVCLGCSLVGSSTQAEAA